MHKNVFQLFFLPSLLLVTLTCSKLDTVTSAGEEIVKSVDPNQVNFGNNFATLVYDQSLVTGSWSLPQTANTNFGYHINHLFAGTGKGYSAAGHLSFKITPSFSSIFKTSDKLDTVKFVFDTATVSRLGTTTSYGSFTLYSTMDTSGYNASSTMATRNKIDTLQHDSANNMFVVCCDSLHSDLTKSIFNACLAYDSCSSDASAESCRAALDTSSFNFAIAGIDSTGIAAFSHAPAMVVIYTRDSTVRYDTLKALTSTLVSESEKVIDSLYTKPVSSYTTQRTAVFKIDFSPLVAAMDSTGLKEILSAAAVLTGTRSPSDTIDSIPIVTYWLTTEAITDGNVLDESLDTIRKYYGTIKTLLQPADEATTVTLPVDYFLQNHLSQHATVFYLYLQISPLKNILAGDHVAQEIIWQKPRFKAVLTTIN